MNLTRKEQELIVEALMAVAPFGGGSPQHTLSLKLQAEWGVGNEAATPVAGAFWVQVARLQRIAWREVEDVRTGNN